MKILEQVIRKAKVSTLKEHPRNPRKGDESRIAESIDANGFFGTIIVQKSTGYVLAGNHRLRVLRNGDIDEIDIAEIDVDDEAALRILIVDNKTSDNGTYDSSELVAILEELNASAGIVGTGYHQTDLDKLIHDVERSSSSELSLTGGAAGGLLPGGDVSQMNFSTVRQIALYYDQESADEFDDAVTHLKEHFGANNISDAVIGAVRYARDKTQGK